MIKTLKLRIKGKTNQLNKLAASINFVWNYVNNLSFETIRNKSKFLSAYDMHSYLAGSSKQLNLHSHSVQETAEQYCIRRKQFKKRKLKYRGKKALGWLPFKTGTVSYKEGVLVYNKHKFKVWDSYGLSNYKFRSGSFNQDAKGNWYINIAVEAEEQPSLGKQQIGIDLGLKTLATCSNGTKIDNIKPYAKLEKRLAKAQRAKHKKQVKNIHAKIKNSRKDYLHKDSTKLVQQNNLIVIGNINSSKLAKTNMAKSVLDASWSMFKTMLEYKAIRQQVKFLVVNEAYTSVTCSGCNSHTGPSGLVGLQIREWKCSNCNALHDRDINAAKNILRLGHQALAVGISSLKAGEDVNKIGRRMGQCFRIAS